ncbi:uncharacterized protein LOC131438946 [Malaya genurostris]|uniref:uncharacterized protein LOC131438946 n=1 Tax=Malaya genurostris TaxID=325434 RepID=UPI0026F39205|nr:uncharacterized protein LOC131438946 [Malaya genurostris]
MGQIVPVCVMVLCAVLYHSTLEANALRYEIIIDRFEPFPNTDSSLLSFGTLRLSRKARNVFVVTGAFELFKNVDNDYKISTELFFAQSTSPLFSSTSGACDTMSSDNELLNRLRNVSNLPPPGTCPIKKGVYQIDDYVLDENQLPVMAWKGTYKIVIKYIHNSEIKVGSTWHFSIV